MKPILSKVWMIARDVLAVLCVILIFAVLAIPMFLAWINEKLDPTTAKEKWDSDNQGWYP